MMKNFKIHSLRNFQIYNTVLLINLVTFNVIIGLLGFKCAILLFVFYRSHVLLRLYCSITVFFCVKQLFSSVQFNYFVSHYYIFFSVIFLVVALGIMINILIYSNPFPINTNFLLIVSKNFALAWLSPLSLCEIVIIQVTSVCFKHLHNFKNYTSLPTGIMFYEIFLLNKIEEKEL